MTAGKVILALGHEYLSGEGKLLFERSMRGPLSCPLRPRRFSVRTFPFDHCPHRPLDSGATEQGIAAVSREKAMRAEIRQAPFMPPRSRRSGRGWSSAVTHAHSRKINHPNNGKRDNDGGNAEAEHKSDIVPLHTPPTPPRPHNPPPPRSPQ